MYFYGKFCVFYLQNQHKNVIIVLYTLIIGEFAMAKQAELEKAISWILRGNRFVVLLPEFKNQVEKILNIRLKLLKNRKYMVCNN